MGAHQIVRHLRHVSVDLGGERAERRALAEADDARRRQRAQLHEPRGRRWQRGVEGGDERLRLSQAHRVGRRALAVRRTAEGAPLQLEQHRRDVGVAHRPLPHTELAVDERAHLEGAAARVPRHDPLVERRGPRRHAPERRAGRRWWPLTLVLRRGSRIVERRGPRSYALQRDRGGGWGCDVVLARGVRTARRRRALLHRQVPSRLRAARGVPASA
eukprot:6238666-Prymnesium_polylepis.1